jgi:hypothetical protein
LYRVLLSNIDLADPPHRIPPLAGTLSADRVDFLAKHVLNLALDSWVPGQREDIENLYTLCSGVRNLACYFHVTPSFIAHLERMRPLRLYIDAYRLFAGAPTFSNPGFANVTHLELVDADLSVYTDESWRGLVSLPYLSHLAVNSYYGFIPFSPPRLHWLLEEAQLLQALILIVEFDTFFIDTNSNGLHDEPISAYPTHDPRFLATVTNSGGNHLYDWVLGAWGGADVWVRADEFIRLKRCGGISSTLTSSRPRSNGR